MLPRLQRARWAEILVEEAAEEWKEQLLRPEGVVEVGEEYGGEGRMERKAWKRAKGFEEEDGDGAVSRLRVERDAAWRAACLARLKAPRGKGAGRGRRGKTAYQGLPGEENSGGDASGGARKRVRRTITACARAEEEMLVEGGGVADNKGQYTIQGVLEVRNWRGRGDFEALVRWRGVDPSSGGPWPEEWVEAQDLSAGAKEAARQLRVVHLSAVTQGRREVRAGKVAAAAAARERVRGRFRAKPAGARESPMQVGGAGGAGSWREGGSRESCCGERW